MDCYYTSSFSNPNYKGGAEAWVWDDSFLLKPIPLSKISGGDKPKFQCLVNGYEQVYAYFQEGHYYEYVPKGKESHWTPMYVESLPGSSLTVTFSAVTSSH